MQFIIPVSILQEYAVCNSHTHIERTQADASGVQHILVSFFVHLRDK